MDRPTAANSSLRAWARIDRAALRHNVKTVNRLCGPTRVTAVVKANAYGHTVECVVPAIRDLVDGFAVATINEAIAVRSLCDTLPVIVLSEFNAPDQIELFRTHRLQPVVHRQAQVEWLCAQPVLAEGVWLKIDSGMRRLGFEPSELSGVVDQFRSSGQGFSLMSHMASAQDMASDQTDRQLEQFLSSTQDLNAPRSIANSASLAINPKTHLDRVRPGLLIYGVSPFDNAALPDSLDGPDALRPAMALEARLIAVKQVNPGDRIGYGGTRRVSEPGLIGIVGIGYADGYPQCVHETGYVLHRDRRAALAGRVSMDMLTIDLGGCPDAKEGDPVQLWGDQLPVAEVAEWAGTIPYELLSRVAARVPRIEINN